MTETVSHHGLIREARAEIRALRNPGIRPDAWRSVTDLLAAIAGYLPDCWPSERTLAKKLGKHQQNVHRTLNRARDLGLVTTTVRPLEGSLRDGQSYHLVCLSTALRAAITRHQFQTSLDVRRTSSSSKKMNTDPSSEGSSRAGAAGQGGGVVVPFNRPTDDDWSSPAIGEDPNAPLPVAAPVQTDPAVYLWRHFVHAWAAMQRQHREHRVTRAGPPGRGIGYIRRWIKDEGYSPEHIEAYLDAFVEAVAAGDVVVAEGQFAWQRLTAWWGTTDIEDPAERQAMKTRASDAVAAARAYWAEQDRAKGLTGA